MLMMRETMHVWRQKLYGNSLYFLLNFPMNLKMILFKGFYFLSKEENGLDEFPGVFLFLFLFVNAKEMKAERSVFCAEKLKF